jgi:hypothetical protein
VTLALCSQLDLDMEVARANKDRPQTVEEHSQTLLPTDVTTGPQPDVPLSHEDVFGIIRKPAPREEEDDIDVDSVFAKLKDLKVKE